MGASADRAEGCATCRFWNPGPQVCRRHAPAGGAVPVWPPTAPADWCGDWRPADGPATDHDPPAGAVGRLAADLYVRRAAPGLRPADPATLLTQLLGRLPPDARRVLVRAHGLDGRPVGGLREVVKELGLRRDRARSLLAYAEAHVSEALAVFAEAAVAHRAGAV